jgi:hypothetical protein
MGIGYELLGEQPARFATIAKDFWLGAYSLHVSCPLVETAYAAFSAHFANRWPKPGDALQITLNSREHSDANRGQ